MEGNTLRSIFFGCFIADWLLYNFAAGSFHKMKLCSRLYSIVVEFYSAKTEKSVFEPPFGDLGVTYALHLQSGPKIWQIAVHHFCRSYLQLIIWTAFRSVKLLSWDQSQNTINRAIYQLLKILTVMIRAHGGHAECCLNWNVSAYDTSVNFEF